MKKVRPQSYPQNILFDTEVLNNITENTKISRETTEKIDSYIRREPDTSREIIADYYKNGVAKDVIIRHSGGSAYSVSNKISAFANKIRNNLGTIIEDDEICKKLLYINEIQRKARLILANVEEIEKYTQYMKASPKTLSYSEKYTLEQYADKNNNEQTTGLYSCPLKALRNKKEQVDLLNIYYFEYSKAIKEIFTSPKIQYNNYNKIINGRKDAYSYIISNFEEIRKYKDAERGEADPETDNEKYLQKISINSETLKVSNRAINALYRGGIKNIYELSIKSRKDLSRIRNMGEKCINEIEEAVKEYGIIIN